MVVGILKEPRSLRIKNFMRRLLGRSYQEIHIACHGIILEVSRKDAREEVDHRDDSAF